MNESTSLIDSVSSGCLHPGQASKQLNFIKINRFIPNIKRQRRLVSPDHKALMFFHWTMSSLNRRVW